MPMPLKHELTHNSPMVTNVAGGNQSYVPRDYTLVPADALAQVARVLHDGCEKYGKDNWRLINSNDHLNHCLNHIYLYLAGNTQEDHLSHAATRLLMSLELECIKEDTDEYDD